MNIGKLPVKFKREWVKALRSGEYQQGKGRLYNDHNNTYCCLAVACLVKDYSLNDIADGGIITPKFKRVPKILYGQNGNRLSQKLSQFNDQKNRSFNWIASYIERYL